MAQAQERAIVSNIKNSIALPGRTSTLPYTEVARDATFSFLAPFSNNEHKRDLLVKDSLLLL